MAKKPTYIKLSSDQKNELRRLTQKANRRISAFAKEYEKKGLTIIPREVSGGIQHKSQWATDKYAISRSTKFETERAFREHMRWLRQFDNANIRPTVTEYKKVQQRKLKQAVETSLGQALTPEQKKAIDKMGLGEMADFWRRFSDVSRRLGVRYSSTAAMEMTLELFDEDLDHAFNSAL